ncbi:formate dehydrogenase accessory sulfurtransferase FdhD [soil metagenome]
MIAGSLTKSGAIVKSEVLKVNSHQSFRENDYLAREEPLEIRLEYGPERERKIQNVSITMRTPGNDLELALGFLFSEGIIRSAEEISTSGQKVISCAENKENILKICLKEHIQPVLKNMERNFYTTSSCGVCGKASLKAIRTLIPKNLAEPEALEISAKILHQLPQLLRRKQNVFEETGGLHASAIFDTKGNLIMLREDVGRHNALDKLIGAAFSQNQLPLNNIILLLSGRISFELVQKAAMAGIQIVAAVGAPSSLAVELAREFKITLVGFLSSSRFNVYNAAHRIKLDTI